MNKAPKISNPIGPRFLNAAYWNNWPPYEEQVNKFLPEEIALGSAEAGGQRGRPGRIDNIASKFNALTFRTEFELTKYTLSLNGGGKSTPDEMAEKRKISRTLVYKTLKDAETVISRDDLENLSGQQIEGVAE